VQSCSSVAFKLHGAEYDKDRYKPLEKKIPVHPVAVWAGGCGRMQQTKNRKIQVRHLRNVGYNYALIFFSDLKNRRISLMTKYKSVVRSICFAATIIALLIFNPVSVNAKDFSVGLKSGIVLNRISSIDKLYSYSQNEGYPKYAYPPGLYAALFGEVRFFY